MKLPLSPRSAAPLAALTLGLTLCLTLLSPLPADDGVAGTDGVDGTATPSGSSAPVAGPDDPIGLDGARHLLGRTGFGAPLAQLREFSRLDRRAAVERVLATLQTEPLLPPPEFLELPVEERTLAAGASREERQRIQRLRRRHGQELAAWWVAEMALTDSPFTEVLTLFWHDHFVSELRKVRAPELMWRQNLLLRQHAAGNFRELLREISTDPAMVIYLDTQQNRKGRPNENYARELFELFTLGEGHYTESDVKEAARALTGWRVNRASGSPGTNFVPRFHDDGEKRIFGVTAEHDLDSLLALVLARPRVATFITEELWRAFVSPDLEAETIEALAGGFRESGYELRPLLRGLLLSDAFWRETNRGALFRSPVDLVIGTVRLLESRDFPPASLHRTISGMGQALLSPPNVKGWPGGERWITSDSLLQRRQFLDRALLGRFIEATRGQTMDGGMRGGGMRGGRMRPGQGAMDSLRAEWTALGGSNPERDAALTQCLCPLPAVFERVPGELPAQTLQRLLLDPTYQLK